MPRERRGQMITFAIERDDDRTISGWITVPIRVGDTVAKVINRRGHPEDLRKVKEKNNIRNSRTVLRHKPKRKHDRTVLRLPAIQRAENSFHVLAGDEAPRIVEGYAKFGTVDRPERTGLTVFEGYSPLVMEVAIRFEARRWRGDYEISPAEIERDIFKLEQMAGRGRFAGASTGPPPIIRVSTTDGNDVVPLIPHNYQNTNRNPHGPLWRVAGIEWDANPLRHKEGNRIRQLATVTLQEHVPLNLLSRSAVKRAGTRPEKKKTTKKTPVRR